MPRSRHPGTTDELLRLYKNQKKAIQKRLADFAGVPPEEYFYEVLYCLLTPQSSAVNAGKAIRVLQLNDFAGEEINPEHFLHTEEYYIRFHKTKAQHLLRCKAQFPVILDKLTSASTGEEIREWLVGNVKGLGWKEASHVLRNIGYRDLAILDRHILRNMVRFGALRCLPKTLSSKNYKQIEQKFRTFSEQLGIPMDEMDLLFWSMETGIILK
jgi:N-glycosylase/DNA lyase